MTPKSYLPPTQIPKYSIGIWKLERMAQIGFSNAIN